MTRAGTARRGVYMSDGVMNVALLKTEGDEKPGLYHFGMWVDDLDEAEKKVKEAGGTYLAGRPTSALSFYEAKYHDPDGVVFDLTHTGWRGAVKEVVPAASENASGGKASRLRHGSADTRSTKNHAPSPSSVGKAATIPSSIARHSRLA